MSLDLGGLLKDALIAGKRPNDGLLHASSHIVGSLRHVQLEVAGAPTVEQSFAREMPLFIGQSLHDFLHATLRARGIPYMAEVKLTPWMPAGWGGTADAVIWQPERKTFRLRDFKSQAGRGMRYIDQDGAKDEHTAQVSLYWYALKDMGLEMDPCVDVEYLPKDEGGSITEPLLTSFKPTPKRDLYAEAAYRARRVDEYRESLGQFDDPEFLEGWVTSELEPPQERVQKLYYDRSTETWDVKLVPHWSAAYCPFPDELCDCSTHGQTKIGFYDRDGQYYARKGYEDIVPEVAPD